MKKIILAAAIAAFSFTAQAETTGENTCVDITASLATMSESAILDNLTDPGCGMSLNDAVNAIIAAGGNQQNTLAAAMIINPDFQYAQQNDPTAGLQATAAGLDDGGSNSGFGSGGTKTIAFTGGTGGSGGGGGTVRP